MEGAIILEPNTQSKKLRLDELFEIDKVIALETLRDNVIGEVSKTIVNKESLYILDKKKSKSVFIFSLDGSFKNRVKRGDSKDPFNPFDMSDICYSGSTNELLVLDGGKNTVFVYDGDGKELQESFEVDIDAHAISCLSNGSIVVKNYNLEKSYSPLLYEIIRKEGENIRGFEHFATIKDKIIFMDDHYFYNLPSNETFFLDQYNDTIFNINPEIGLQPKRIINFGKLKAPLTFYKSNENYPTYYQKQLNSSYPFRMLFYFENDKHILFPYFSVPSLFHYYLDKTTMTSSSINLGMEEGLVANPIGFYSNGLIVCFETYDLLSKNESSFPFKNKLLISQIEEITSEFSLSQEDNQILVFLKLKQI